MFVENLTTITLLLPTIYAKNREVNLIHGMNNFFNFDHNLYLLDQLVDINRFISTKQHSDNNAPRSIHVFDGDGGNISSSASVIEIASKNTFMIVARESFQFENNLNFLTQIKVIQRLHVTLKIGIFFTQNTSDADLRKLFEWSWQHRIINIFAARSSYTGSVLENSLLNIFTFNPFGTFRVLNLTGSVAYDNFFLKQNSNFQESHVPQVEYFPGTATLEFWRCVEVLNASFISVKHDFTNFNDTWLQELYNNGIDIVAGFMRQDSLKKIHLYPLHMEPMHIIVPEALPYSDISAYLMAIISTNLFGYLFVSISVVVLVLLVFRYIKQRKILIIQSITDVFNLLMNDNGSVRYSRLSSLELMLIIPLTFVGLLFVSGILSALLSFAARPVQQHQINTIEEVYESNLPIITGGEDWKVILADAFAKRTNISNINNWTARIHVMYDQQFFNLIFSYNRNVSLVIEKSAIDQILNVQKRLQIYGYHRISPAMFTYLGYFFVHGEFPFVHRLNEISLWIQSAGLFNYWIKIDRTTTENHVWKVLNDILKSENDSDVYELPIPMEIVFGWIASIILFGIEIIWYKVKPSLVKILSCVLASFKLSLVQLLILIVKIENQQ